MQGPTHKEALDFAWEYWGKIPKEGLPISKLNEYALEVAEQVAHFTQGSTDPDLQATNPREIALEAYREMTTGILPEIEIIDSGTEWLLRVADLLVDSDEDEGGIG